MYAPLKYIEHCEDAQNKILEETGKPGHPLAWLENCTKEDIRINNEELLRMAMRLDFFDKNYNGPHKDIHDVIISKTSQNVLTRFTGKDVNDPSLIADVRDFVAMQPVLDLWKGNKQVYKIDREFANILIQTDKLIIYRDIIEHLPYKCFYIDLSLTDIDSVEGEFVNVYKNVETGDYCITVYVLTTQMIIYSHYTHIYFIDDSCEIEKPKNLVFPDAYLSEDTEDLLNNTVLKRDKNLEDLPRAELTMLALQFLMYIGSHEPDIEENEVSKQTYNPSVIPKNSFKEVRTWDVGVKYGNAIRLLNKRCKEQTKNNSIPSVESVNKARRKAPRPHMRCAHWQRFHVGEGRVNTIVKWIPPVMVIGTEEIPITIHKVS